MSSLSLWKIPGHCLSQWQSGDCPIKTRETWEDSTLEVWRGERAGLYWREVSPSPPSWGTVSTPLHYSLHILHTSLLKSSQSPHPPHRLFTLCFMKCSSIRFCISWNMESWELNSIVPHDISWTLQYPFQYTAANKYFIFYNILFWTYPKIYKSFYCKLAMMKFSADHFKFSSNSMLIQ